ncbi:membrane protein [Burkholderia lata]|uniref:Membrane protein n=1 Tax=Burkholderia lata (strain ATCC 17760 / DSM 23089 / LMG 22485 / NCIMB 9086 / R18194 / 383) TaxID=482957 RepID=A0A6P2NTG1_BURL3|nr:membrane protein [Burkholderia lata]
MTRIIYRNTPTVPNGLYANIDHATALVIGAKMYERLTLCLDDDGRWHLTGYVPRQSQNLTQ